MHEFEDVSFKDVSKDNFEWMFPTTAQPPEEPESFHAFEYQDFLVFIKLTSYWLNFKAFEIVGKYVEHCDEEGGKFLYMFNKIDGKYSNDTTGDIKEAEVFIAAFLKWDGCMDGHMQSSHFHYCGQNDMLRVSRLFQRIYVFAEEHMTHFDEGLAS